MKTTICLHIATVVILVAFQQCNSQQTPSNTDFNLLLKPQTDSLLITFSEDINKEDSTSIFVLLKNIDANTLKIYLVAKKALRSDFEFIGLPITANKKNDINFYFYSGMEKLLTPDTTFWNNHTEIYDDRLRQAGGLYETPIVKKALYIFEDGRIEGLQPFDDMIFVGNPIDSIKFR